MIWISVRVKSGVGLVNFFGPDSKILTDKSAHVEAQSANEFHGSQHSNELQVQREARSSVFS